MFLRFATFWPIRLNTVVVSTLEKQLLIGAHTSTAGGVHNALFEGQRIGATTVQLFTSNQKQWKGRILSQENLDQWFLALDSTGMQKVMSHDSYLINLGAHNPEVLEKSRKAFHEEIERCLQLKISYLNFHPGAYVGSSPEQCLDLIVESLLEVCPLLEKSELMLLLECTAGQGSSVGYQFEQISYILEKVKGKLPIGVCIDTCHVFVAGYDLRTEKDCEKMLSQFDSIIGIDYLKAFHFNDSMKGLGTRVDRHRCLGQGEIGLDCFRFLMNDPRTKWLPKYLETPEGPSVWAEEIALLKRFVKE